MGWLKDLPNESCWSESGHATWLMGASKCSPKVSSSREGGQFISPPFAPSIAVVGGRLEFFDLRVIRFSVDVQAAPWKGSITAAPKAAPGSSGRRKETFPSVLRSHTMAAILRGGTSLSSGAYGEGIDSRLVSFAASLSHKEGRLQLHSLPSTSLAAASSPSASLPGAPSRL
ncbi:unnamed protein product, partial [Ectocarpus sp. 13 AM-2016]